MSARISVVKASAPMVWTAEEIAAACGVPVEWVPPDFAALSDEEIVDRIETRRDAERALQRSPLAALLRRGAP